MADKIPVRRILLLEDDFILVQLYSTVLKSAGYDVTATTTFHAASDLLHRTSFDLCISDINVGLVDGFHVLNEMDTMRRKYGMEVLMISGS
ncbi:MAG: response regulator, partial [Aggregatilineales bacterium]